MDKDVLLLRGMSLHLISQLPSLEKAVADACSNAHFASGADQKAYERKAAILTRTMADIEQYYQDVQEVCDE